MHSCISLGKLSNAHSVTKEEKKCSWDIWCLQNQQINDAHRFFPRLLGQAVVSLTDFKEIMKSIYTLLII